MFKKFVLKLFKQSLVKPCKYCFTILGSISYVLNKLDRVLIEQVGYSKVKQLLQIFLFLIRLSINSSYKETVFLEVSKDYNSVRLLKFCVFLHNKVPVVDTQIFEDRLFKIGHYERCFLVLFIKPIRSIINIDLNLIKILFELA